MSDRERELDEECLAGLYLEFAPRLVKNRSQGGRPFDYVKVEPVENRLDDVVGPANWEDSYREIDAENVECTLAITLPSGRVVRKRGVGARKDGAKEGDAGGTWRAAYTYGLKSAAKKFGVARYLNNGGFPDFVQRALDRIDRREAGAAPTETPAAEVPPPPAERIPGPPPDTRANGHAPAPGPAPDPEPARSRNQVNQPAYTGPPRSGRALFAWTKDQEQKHEVSLLRYLNGWGKLQEFPGRMVDWDADQVREGYEEGIRKLGFLTSDSQEVPDEALAN